MLNLKGEKGGSQLGMTEWLNTHTHTHTHNLSIYLSIYIYMKEDSSDTDVKCLPTLETFPSLMTMIYELTCH